MYYNRPPGFRNLCEPADVIGSSFGATIFIRQLQRQYPPAFGRLKGQQQAVRLVWDPVVAGERSVLGV